MKEIAVLFKFLNFYAHNAHIHVSHSQFFSDHKYLNDLYEDYDAAYDSIVERMLGLGMEVNEFELIKLASDKFQGYNQDNFEFNVNYFSRILSFEKELCAILEEVAKSVSLGTNDLLAGLADDSEIRQYKLTQRVKQ